MRRKMMLVAGAALALLVASGVALTASINYPDAPTVTIRHECR
jgi:hypothetical protein